MKKKWRRKKNNIVKICYGEESDYDSEEEGHRHAHRRRVSQTKMLITNKSALADRRRKWQSKSASNSGRRKKKCIGGVATVAARIMKRPHNNGIGENDEAKTEKAKSENRRSGAINNEENQ